MPEKKVDRRTLKTQRQIKEALAELLAQKELRHITVKEISDRADIHRVTFYKHYLDIYDLYDKLEKEILDDLGELVNQFYQNPSKDFGFKLIKYITDNPKIFKMIFSQYNTGELKRKFFEMIENGFRYIKTKDDGLDFNDPRLAYLATAWASICVAVIEKWVENDFKESQEFINGLLIETDAQLEGLL